MKAVRKAFTLIELIVVIAIIGLLLGIMLPVISSARTQCRKLSNKNNQRQISLSVTEFSFDSNDRTPPSVATIRSGSSMNYHDPRLIKGYEEPSRQHSSVSAYLHEYIEDPEIMFCPQAPDFPSYMQDAWLQGDDYQGNNPVYGQYSLLWGGYTAVKINSGTLFRGPRRLSSTRSRDSKVLLCDFVGFDNCRWVDNYTGGKLASCNKFISTNVASEKIPPPYPPLWSSSSKTPPDWNSKPDIEINLNAALVDGSVQVLTMSHLTPAMRYNQLGPDPFFGIYYLPENF